MIITIDKELHNLAERAAGEFGNVSAQIEYWALIGKTAIEHPEISIRHIKNTYDYIFLHRQTDVE